MSRLVQVNVYADEDVYERLRLLARRRRVSIGALIREGIDAVVVAQADGSQGRGAEERGRGDSEVRRIR